MSVLVIDKGPKSRARTIARSFVLASVETFLVDGRSQVKGGDWAISDDQAWSKRVDLPNTLDFVVLHNTNQSDLDTVKSRLAPKAPVIRYTGGQPPRHPPKGELWIRSRSMTSEADALTPQEAQQLLQWVQSGLKPESMPAVLSWISPDRAKMNLAALAILCQAYLAVHNDSDIHEPVLLAEASSDLDVVRKAAAIAGWREASACVIPDCQAKRERVRSRSWWLNVFPSLCDDGPQIFGPDLPSEVRNLLSTLVENSLDVSPATVAQAYIALAGLK